MVGGPGVSRDRQQTPDGGRMILRSMSKTILPNGVRGNRGIPLERAGLPDRHHALPLKAGLTWAGPRRPCPNWTCFPLRTFRSGVLELHWRILAQRREWSKAPGDRAPDDRKPRPSGRRMDSSELHAPRTRRTDEAWSMLLPMAPNPGRVDHSLQSGLLRVSDGKPGAGAGLFSASRKAASEERNQGHGPQRPGPRTAPQLRGGL